MRDRSAFPKGQSDLSFLAGRVIKLRISLKNAELYSFWFS